MTREEAILIIGEHKKNAERLAGKTLAGQKSAEAFNMAIEALSAEPCEDAIRRQAVMDAMYDLCGEESLKDNPWRDNPHIDSIIDAIESLPSVTPKQKMGRWIPVSERLPEKDGDYLLFGKVVEDDTDDTFIGMYDVCAEKFGYWEDYYDKNTLGFLDSELIEYNKVIAWMPLPEPYLSENPTGSNSEEGGEET